MTGRLLPCGERAVLAELDDLDAALALYRALDAARPEATEDIVLGARTVLLTVGHPEALATAAATITQLLAGPAVAANADEGPEVTIGVRYDGPDLEEVAALTGLEIGEVIAAHTRTPWRVAFCGFAPGFAYLVGGDPRLTVPRKSEPRTAVPAGSVGLAGHFSGVYPRSSPGGWQLLGTTDAPLWDADRHSPALLLPGGRVRFRSVDALAPTAPSASGRQTFSARALKVICSGPFTTIQDAGRPGWAHIGVTSSGAADRASLRLANRLVGNPEDAAVLEAVFGGLKVTATDSLVLAITGAHAPATLNHMPVAHASPLCLTAGDCLTVGTPASGLRSYIAVSGGLATGNVLGGQATDTLSGLGPRPIASGDVLAVGPQSSVPTLQTAAPPLRREHAVVDLEVLPGPRSDWLADPDALIGPWEISDRADRVGVRLSGTPLARSPKVSGRELPSEGVVRGSIQLPGNGFPVVFGPDHPVTGGYPVVGVLTEASSDKLAQARPGQHVLLHPGR